MVSLRKEGNRYIVQINARQTVRALSNAGLTTAERPRLYYTTKDVAREVRADLHRAERHRNWSELLRLYRKHRSRLPATPDTLADLVEAFVDAQLKGAPTTPHWRAVKLTRLRKFLDHSKAVLPEDVTYAAAERFLGHVSAKLKRKTRFDYAKVLKSFSKWLRLCRHLEVDPLEGLNAGSRQATTQRRASSVDEVVAIMAALPVRVLRAHLHRHGKISDTVRPNLEAHGRRHQLIVATLFATAMRPGELRNLIGEQLDLNAGVIRFSPDEVKTGRCGEEIYLAPWLVERLRAWQEAAGPSHPKAHVLRVEKNFIRRYLIPAACAAGVDPDPRLGTLGLHSIGRTSLSTWLTEQADLDGHLADLFTRHELQGSTRAKNYVKRRPERMREIAARIPPLFDLLATRERSHVLPHVASAQDGAGLAQHDRKTASPAAVRVNAGKAVETGCPKREHA